MTKISWFSLLLLDFSLTAACITASLSYFSIFPRVYWPLFTLYTLDTTALQFIYCCPQAASNSINSRCIDIDFLLHSGSLFTALRQYKNALGMPLVSYPQIAVPVKVSNSAALTRQIAISPKTEDILLPLDSKTPRCLAAILRQLNTLFIYHPQTA